MSLMECQKLPRVRAHYSNAFTLVELLCVIVVIAVLVSLLAPTLPKGKSRAKDVVCRNNLRQLGLAVRMYADDHNSKLPAIELVPSYPIDPKAPLPSMKTVFGPYLLAGFDSNRTNGIVPVLRCPSDQVGRFEKEGTSYEWNVRLNHLNIDQDLELGRERIKILLRGPAGSDPIDIDEEIPVTLTPPETPLAWDFENFHSGGPAGSSKNVLYGDGHVSPLK